MYGPTTPPRPTTRVTTCSITCAATPTTGSRATLSLGLDRGELPYQLRQDTNDDAARFLTAGRGIAWPNAGPRADYWKDAAYGVTTEAEGIDAVRELAARRVDIVKIWVDDRDGSVTPLPPSLYRPIIDEAHRLGLRVVAHVYYLADAKELLRAGVDGFAHGIRDLEIDDEIVELFRQRPQVFVLPNLPDTPVSAADIDWLSETLPASQDRDAAAERPSGAATAAAVRRPGAQPAPPGRRRGDDRVRHRCRHRRAIRLVGACRARRHGGRRPDAGAGDRRRDRDDRPHPRDWMTPGPWRPARAPTSSSSTPTRSRISVTRAASARCIFGAPPSTVNA